MFPTLCLDYALSEIRNYIIESSVETYRLGKPKEIESQRESNSVKVDKETRLNDIFKVQHCRAFVVYNLKF